MKFKVVVSVLSFIALSLNVVAYADTGHHHKTTSHEEHATTIGKLGNPTKITRTIVVDMNDTMRFLPNKVSVKRGETIKFVVKNSGKIKHEMVLGSQKELQKHAEMMRKMPEMEHADENQISVEPGKTGEIVWQFTNKGTVDFACLQPGHFEAGMKGKLVVN